MERKVFFILLGVLIVSILLGYMESGTIEQAFQKSGFDQELQKQVEKISASPNFWYIFSSIFLNNFFASIQVILLGALLFFFPFGMLIMNGMLVGYILAQVSQLLGKDPFFLFATMILPHGIFELPAIILACILGFRFGWFIVSFLSTLFTRDEEKRRMVAFSLRNYLQRFSPMLFGITILLVLAAAIEAALFFTL